MQKTLRIFLGGLCASALLAGCANNPPKTMLIQKATASMLGLASTDEVTVSNIERTDNKIGSTDLTLGSDITYLATTARGRKFACKAQVTPGLLPGMEDTYSRVECSPATASNYKVKTK